MKRLILFELIILFLATTFESDSPPGWIQQTLPVTEIVRDIYFFDSSTGWVVSSNQTFPANDTGYIMKTTNGGNNWAVQLDSMFNYYAVQFIDLSNGYVVGGTGRAKFLKTTNGGSSWSVSTPFGSNMYAILDLAFVNKDTGWVCGDDSFGGGVFKTTNGGGSWVQQLNNTYRPTKLFFINKDTGWVGTSDANGRLFRTTNGGVNWNLQYTINGLFETIHFINGYNGWIRAGASNGIQYTTNGGFNWADAQGDVIGGFDTKFINDSVGYSGTFSSFKILKSTNGGKTWGYQVTPILSGRQTAVLRNDTLNAWAGQIMHTTDGGGSIILGIKQIGTEIPSDYKLFQNYPNPFNPATNIIYELKVNKFVKLKVFDVTGKEIIDLVNREQQAGTYNVDWDANNLTSGVYFYSLIIDGITVDTKKMILLK